MLAKYIAAGIAGSFLLASAAFAEDPAATYGSIKAAVISVGGFLGMGSRYVAIPFEKLKFSTEPVAYTSAGASNTMPAKPASTTTTGSATNPPAAAAAAKPNPWYPDHAVFNATKDELQAMPEFKYSTE